ncbi:LEAF RUST 10 DISEASE-RESISTANCE LOCUS RECEPTOR-LIKE PROTEIN KINASE-like 2.4 isoform X2 [Ipomoea triloba]|uniref:LEAF RUST 10 DISEASE-RESISTANCE LOCUS RECEPTOR-LIKE PROTEIN KINASE-like 2.4 isoform X2 n=1 Tax=Ipomoea triloba TaxID=35885 RepID=UPI00125D1221|nr:LEAF RUST 10 DISEASE-RESISTANCE LOCUS RECEPTOR-LIKE PROTEIN KINASE-like 2.4 isoform X2 [Ipomoea triloba]
MALLFNPACFFSFLLPLMATFYFVHGEARFLSNCTKEFSCGAIGFVGFPFVKHTEPHCGLVAVKCDTTPPIVQLGTGGDWYPLLSVMKPRGVDNTYTIDLEDSKLQRPFESRNYSNLNYTIHFHNSPSVTFLNWDASTLNTYFKCNDSEADDIGNYERYNCSDGFSLYYKRHLPENPKCDAVNCTMYPTPIIIQQTNDGLTAQFVLRMEVSKTCQECYQGGGQCTEDSNNDFRCAQGNLSTTGKRNLKLILAAGGGTLILTFMSTLLFYIYTKKLSLRSCVDLMTKIKLKKQDVEEFLKIHGPFALKRFSYSEVKKITNSFKNELGQGGFGSVYKGKLRNGNFVAVKVLKELKASGEEFINEVASISRTSHINIVTLVGFCIEDFGLAKLCTRKESIVSVLGARGTIGYIAPEVVCKNIGGVSHKSDVYSYGMMVLEMVGGRKNVDIGVSCNSKIYFPHWIYTRFVLDDELGLIGVMNEEENECARKMLIASLWCIQTDPSTRPSISRVVEMLEGKLEYLQIPPKPYLYSPTRLEEQHSSSVFIT